MKSGTVKSAQRDASGVVRQLPLTGTLRDSGVTGQSPAPQSNSTPSPEAPASGRTAFSRTGSAPRREPGGSLLSPGRSPSTPGGSHATHAPSPAEVDAFDADRPASYVERGAAVLCNIAEQTWILHRTHGTFVVAGREPGEAVALTIISARTGAIDLGDKRTLEFPITAREIAEDLAREINSDGGEGSYFGVFVCKGDEPSDAELLIAREQLGAFYRNLVATADKEWERTHNVVFISDLQRRAARELKLEKEWSYEPQQRIDCPACGEKLKPGVAVCRVCGAVLDRAKAQQFGLGAQATPAQAPSPAASGAATNV